MPSSASPNFKQVPCTEPISSPLLQIEEGSSDRKSPLKEFLDSLFAHKNPLIQEEKASESQKKSPLKEFFDSLEARKCDNKQKRISKSNIKEVQVKKGATADLKGGPLKEFFASLNNVPAGRHATVPEIVVTEFDLNSSLKEECCKTSPDKMRNSAAACKLKRRRPVSGSYPSFSDPVEQLKASKHKFMKLNKHSHFDKVVREPSLPALPEHSVLSGSPILNLNPQQFSFFPYPSMDVNDNHCPSDEQMVPLVKAQRVFIVDDSLEDALCQESSSDSVPDDEPKQIVLNGEEGSRRQLIFGMLADAFYNVNNTSESQEEYQESPISHNIRPIVVDCIMKKIESDVTSCPSTVKKDSVVEAKVLNVMDLKEERAEETWSETDLQIEPNVNTKGSKTTQIIGSEMEVESILSEAPSPVVSMRTISKSKSPTLDMLRSVGFVRETKRRWSSEVEDGSESFVRSQNRNSWHGPLYQGKAVYPEKSPRMSIARVVTDTSVETGNSSRPTLTRSKAFDQSTSDEQEVGFQPYSSCLYLQLPSAAQCCPCKCMLSVLCSGGNTVCCFRDYYCFYFI